MSPETPPENKPEDTPIQQLENINQLTKNLQSFVEEIARLIVTKNWFSLLLLFDATLLLFFFPGGIVAKALKSTLNLDFPKQYPSFFWLAVVAIFLAALVIAIQTIQRQTPSTLDFTERKAIKGLRAFTEDDAEVFAQLQRDRDLRECLESITSNDFRLGILTGESGTGKTSFLQAGILPQLVKPESVNHGIYIRFSNQDPIATIDKELAKKLQLSATNNRDLQQILSQAVAAVDKPLILIFDQFEQFFVHFKQAKDIEPLDAVS